MRRLIPLAFMLVGSVLPAGCVAAAQRAGSHAGAPTPSDTLPAAVVQRFVDAANARDAARMASLVAPEAVFATFPDGHVIAQSRDSIHALYARLMPTVPPGMRVTVRNRIVDGHFVVDEEYSGGTAAEEERSTWIYQVLGGLIQRAWVLVGPAPAVP